MDGKRMFVTNARDLAFSEGVRQYMSLVDVERVFKAVKS
jgi:hypothetical protein